MPTTYGPADQAIDITLASLAGNAKRESDFIENTDGYVDILVFGGVTVDGTPDGSKGIYVFAYGSTGGGTFPDPVTGVDAGVTLNLTILNISPLGTIKTPTGSVLHKAGPWSLRAVFGEQMPSRWGIVVANVNSGTPLTSNPADHFFTWQGVNLA